MVDPISEPDSTDGRAGASYPEDSCSDRKIISMFKVTIYVKQLTDLINM